MAKPIGELINDKLALDNVPISSVARMLGVGLPRFNNLKNGYVAWGQLRYSSTQKLLTWLDVQEKDIDTHACVRTKPQEMPQRPPSDRSAIKDRALAEFLTRKRTLLPAEFYERASKRLWAKGLITKEVALRYKL